MQFARPLRLDATGSPVYLEDEVVWRQIAGVTLYDGSEKMEGALEGGIAVVSNYRILWIARDRKQAKCWHLADVSSFSKESAGWFSGSDKLIVYFTKGGSEKYLKIKFGKDDFDECERAARKALSKKSWLILEQKKKAASENENDPAKNTTSKHTYSARHGGIAGLIRRNKEEAARADRVTTSAFKDLESLMENAKKVVSIAEKYAARMQRDASASNGAAKNKAAQFTSLVRTVGLTSPVTRQAVGDDQYLSELARQLARFLTKPLEEAGGMMMLISIYGLYNRARGTDLISPDDLLSACGLLRKLHLKMSLRTFESGVIVVQLDSHSDDSVVKRLLNEVRTKNGPISPPELSEMWKISVIIAKEHLLLAERKGALCRDVSVGGVRFWSNRFLEA